MNGRIAELEAANRQLRGALIFAARRIRALRRDDRSLPLLRRALREARAVATSQSKAATS